MQCLLHAGIDEEDMPVDEAAGADEIPPLDDEDDSAKMEEVD